MNNKIVTIILVILVGAGAFWGGTVYKKSSLEKQGLLRNANNNRVGNFTGGPNGQQGRSQGMRPGGPGGNNGNFVNGEILSRDDKSITVKMPDGGSKIIYFSDSTQVGKSAQGSISDLNTGQQVMVNGTANPDGTVSAQNIQIRPPLNP